MWRDLDAVPREPPDEECGSCNDNEDDEIDESKDDEIYESEDQMAMRMNLEDELGLLEAQMNPEEYKNYLQWMEDDAVFDACSEDCF